MRDRKQNAGELTDRDQADTTSVFTIPNALVVVRILGSFVMLLLADRGEEVWFVGLLLFLLFTDWLDGKIAVRFHQRSVIGARLDSVGDAIMYACLIIGLLWLRPGFLGEETPYIALVAVTYLVSLALAFVRLGHFPAYHTRAAKTCWFLVMVATVLLFTPGWHWPARIAMIAVSLTNLEAIGISCLLREWETDVTSIYHVWRRKE